MLFGQVRNSASGHQTGAAQKVCAEQWQDLIQNAEIKPKQLQLLTVNFPRGFICRRKLQVCNCPTAQLYQQVVSELRGRHRGHILILVSLAFFG